MKLGIYIYIMTPEPISTAYFINPIRVSVCASLLSLQGNGSVKCIPPFGARQRHGKHILATTDTCKNVRIYGRVTFYAARVQRESVGLCVPLSLLGNNSVKKFPRQRRIVVGVIFYAVRVVSKKIRRLVLPRISC
jgi:hypothetical protein